MADVASKLAVATRHEAHGPGADLEKAATYIALDGEVTMDEMSVALRKLQDAIAMLEDDSEASEASEGKDKGKGKGKGKRGNIPATIELNVGAMFQGKGTRSMLYTFALAGKHLIFDNVAEAAHYSVNGYTEACDDSCSLIHEMCKVGGKNLSGAQDYTDEDSDKGSDNDEDYIPEDNESEEVLSDDETEVTDDETE